MNPIATRLMKAMTRASYYQMLLIVMFITRRSRSKIINHLIVVLVSIHSSSSTLSPLFFISHALSSAPSSTISTFNNNELHEVSFSTVREDDVANTSANESWSKIFPAPTVGAAKKTPYHHPGKVFDILGKFYQNRFSYTERNVNNKEIQFKCAHKQAKRFGCCDVNLYLPLTKCNEMVINCLQLVNTHTSLLQRAQSRNKHMREGGDTIKEAESK